MSRGYHITKAITYIVSYNAEAMQNQTYHQELHKIDQLRKSGLTEVALEQIDNYLVKSPHTAQSVDVLSDILMGTNDFVSTIALLKKSTEHYKSNPKLLHKLSEAYLKSGYLDQAVNTANEYGKLTGDLQSKYTLLTTTYERYSKTELAREAYDKIVLNDVIRTRGIRILDAKILIQEKKVDEASKILHALQDSDEAMLETRIEAGFTLAKTYNKVGEYDLAWKSAAKSHDLNPRTWDMGKYEKKMDEVMRIFTKANLDSWAHASMPTPGQTFIVGTPRSGTSLLEQILSMHPDIENAGELITSFKLQKRTKRYSDSFLPYPKCLVDLQQQDADRLQKEYLESVAEQNKSHTIVTNKVLIMHEQMGFVSLFLPDCKKILLTRNPLDNCVSCYLNNLINSGHHYCSNLDDFAKTWLIREKAHQHWQNVFGDACITLSYESLVANQEEETRRLISYLDVPWDENCLQFHTSKRIAATISYDQVNKKMYTSSKGRWSNYEKHLGPVMEQVGDYM